MPFDSVFRTVWPSGETRWLHSHGDFHRDASGKPDHVFGVTQDITVSKRAQEQIAQMTRLYATLSQVNQTIVHVKEADELYASICDIAVGFGEFALAWIGLLDEDSGDVRPVAATGLDLAQWPFEAVNLHRGVFKDGLAATAIRTDKVTVSEDAQRNRRSGGSGEALRDHDFHASAAIPFRLKGESVGVLVIVSHEAGSFAAESEVNLLDEMGLDISFALDSMATEAERERAAVELAGHANRLEITAAASAAFAAVGQDFEAVLDRVARLMSEALADICQIRLLSEDGERLDLIALHALEPGASKTLRALDTQIPAFANGSATMLGVVRTGEPTFLPAVKADDVRASVPSELWPAYAPFAPHSYILVPLRAQGRVLGY